MTVAVPSIAAPEAPTPTTAREPASFDERWAVGEAKGTARDRALRRGMAVAAPILIVLAAIIVYALLGR
jgi:hypothetical protein